MFNIQQKTANLQEKLGRCNFTGKAVILGLVHT